MTTTYKLSMVGLTQQQFTGHSTAAAAASNYCCCNQRTAQIATIDASCQLHVD